MSPGCAEWEAITGFRSPNEYARFCAWIDERVADGTAEVVPVDPNWRDANPLLETWFRCIETGDVWRRIDPDPPGAGAFVPRDTA